MPCPFVSTMLQHTHSLTMNDWGVWCPIVTLHLQVSLPGGKTSGRMVYNLLRLIHLYCKPCRLSMCGVQCIILGTYGQHCKALFYWIFWQAHCSVGSMELSMFYVLCGEVCILCSVVTTWIVFLDPNKVAMAQKNAQRLHLLVYLPEC